LTGIHVVGRQPAKVREGVFQLIAIKSLGLGSYDGFVRYVLYFANALEMISDLFLLESKLLRVVDVLPATAATDFEVLAKRLSPKVRKRIELGHDSVGQLFLPPDYLEVNHIARCYVTFYEYHTILGFVYAFSFGGKIGNRYLFVPFIGGHGSS
jgi:hypothetical protein